MRIDQDQRPLRDEQSAAPILRSVLTCPRCGFSSEEVMPADACLYFHECTACHAVLRPNPGDCCVFCSFGTVKCPPAQGASQCCARVP
jgi:hypothetical protein